MHRGPLWPFAKGSEHNLGVASAVWLLAVFLHRLSGRPFTRLLVWLATPLWLLVLFFFRDPERPVGYQDGIVLAPADGEIVAVTQERESGYFHQDMMRLSIFLSLFDVHVQRAPVRGQVVLLDHRPGQFVQAFKPEASDVNEYIAMGLDNPRFGRVLVKQIAGILARRCVNHMRVGDLIDGGQRFGLIRFSSRVDLYLPADAEILVDVGQHVQGGLTPLATLKPIGSRA